tara:strand:+ start:340 stop:663 length:324 start_codon:yes stop_codon:yes gene_type:complete
MNTITTIPKEDPYIIDIILRENPNWSLSLGGGLYNGYITLPEGHPWFEVDLPDEAHDIHGRITYSEKEGDEWVIGFDTAHAGDTPEKWPIAKVAEEAERLRDIAMKA